MRGCRLPTLHPKVARDYQRHQCHKDDACPAHHLAGLLPLCRKKVAHTAVQQHPQQFSNKIKKQEERVWEATSASMGYSRGVSLDEFAQIFKDLACKDAYNLDGGGSSKMYFQGQVVNNPLGKNRERGTSDILHIEL